MVVGRLAVLSASPGRSACSRLPCPALGVASGSHPQRGLGLHGRLAQMQGQLLGQGSVLDESDQRNALARRRAWLCQDSQRRIPEQRRLDRLVYTVFK